MEVVDMLFICAIVLLIISNAFCYVLYSRSMHLMEYYRSHLQNVINNDTIVDESFATIAEAYGVEEGDLRNYISRRQNELQANGRKRQNLSK